MKIEVVGDGEMNAELYVTKASLQMSRGETEKAVESMKKVVEIGDDMVSVAQAHCFLGEYYFMKQEYILAKENLEWIYERQEEFESDFDDLLNIEFDRANILLDMIEKFSLI